MKSSALLHAVGWLGSCDGTQLRGESSFHSTLEGVLQEQSIVITGPCEPLLLTQPYLATILHHVPETA